MAPARAAFNQILLGGQGQLHALLPILGDVTRRLLLCAAPEIFLTRQSFTPLAEIFRNDDPDEILHLRFGPARYSCVLKGVRNASVIAEHEGRDIYSSSMSPFAVGDVLPAAFAQALLLLDAPRELRLPDGSRIQEHVLGSGLAVSGPLPEEGDPGRDDRAGHWLDGLDVMSAGDFDPLIWEARRADGLGLAMPDGFAALARPGGMSAVRRQLVLVPWNMADPGDFASHLLDRYLDEADPLGSGLALALMPFNETFEAAPRLAAAVGRIKRHPEAQGLLHDGIFFVSAASTRVLPALARLCPFFVIDAADPEFAWSFRRLCALGLRPLVFGAESLEEIGLDQRSTVAIDFFPFEMSEVVHQVSAYGSIHVEAGRVSRRQFRALVAALQDADDAPVGEVHWALSRFVAADAGLALRQALQV